MARLGSRHLLVSILHRNFRVLDASEERYVTLERHVLARQLGPSS